ncbi:MAG: DoxX family protein [Pseudobdellovibrionaceae bacterium]
MKKTVIGARLIFGALFVIFGLNGFLNFIPIPPPPPAAGQFLGALGATGYMFPVIKGIEVIAGVMVLAGVFVPLALTLLAPIVVNIVLYHLILAPAGAALPLLLLALGLFLAWNEREKFIPMLRMK